MSTWVSKEGELFPAKERVVLVNHSDKVIKNPSTEGKYVGEDVQPGEQYIYEGPDRAALYELHQAKQDHLGIAFRYDPDFIGRIRSLGYKDVNAYCKIVGYDKEKVEKEFSEKIVKINQHQIAEKVEAINILGGGVDTSGGGGDRYGGFGTQPKD